MTAKREWNIVLAGVGGQGTLVAGKLLGIVALKLGLDVKVSEVHGMSQRGGSVSCYVKIGDLSYLKPFQKANYLNTKGDGLNVEIHLSNDNKYLILEKEIAFTSPHTIFRIIHSESPHLTI